jgi:hypothetical protein
LLGLNGTALTCPIYAGAAKCNTTKGTEVGQLIITPSSVTWDLYAGLGGREFHLHVSKCPFNDAGDHFPNSTCSEMKMKNNARVPGKYTLVTPEYTLLPTEFVFDSMNYASFLKTMGTNWAGYNPFPLAGEETEHRYISAHMEVCPCGESCVEAPTSSPTAVPTSSPAPTPTSGADPVPTASPALSPSADDGAVGAIGTTGSPATGASAGATAGFVILAVASVLAATLFVYRRSRRARSSGSISSGSSDEAFSLGGSSVVDSV